ncbi:MAG: hypothetical protein AAGK78_14510, partial [Planctomycetota bacterium]
WHFKDAVLMNGPGHDLIIGEHGNNEAFRVEVAGDDDAPDLKILDAPEAHKQTFEEQVFTATSHGNDSGEANVTSGDNPSDTATTEEPDHEHVGNET